MRQCIIYDSNKSDAKLIGIEYIISRKLFDTLPMEERKYWHSHEFEVDFHMKAIIIRDNGARWQ